MGAAQLDPGEGFDDYGLRRSRSIFGPPGQDPGPHADQRLGENVGIDFGGHALLVDELLTDDAGSVGHELKDIGLDYRGVGFSAEKDSNQVAVVRREAHEGGGLETDALLGVQGGQGRGIQAPGQIGQCLIGDLSEEGGLVAEVIVESARGDPSVSSDVVGCDLVESLLGEESPTAPEQPVPGRRSGPLGSGGSGSGSASEWIWAWVDSHVRD